MARNRFFIDHISEEAALTGDEFRHAKNVLRLREGSEISLLVGSGAEYSAIVTKVERDKMLVHVLEKSASDREPHTEVCLLVGALKGDKTELVVQKAAELGASKVAVFSSRYCSAYMNENKLERLNRVSREAAKQCMRTVAPEVVYFETFEEALKSADGYQNKLFACEFLGGSEGSLHGLSGSCALVVGSEGGFSEGEFALAKSLGFTGVSLGKRILRAETAAIAFLSVVMYELGELR